MSENIKFQSICADYSYKNSLIFDLEDDYNVNYDCVDTCLIWNHITFYGIPFGLSDDQMGRIYDGDYRDVVKIGKLHGCLILCKQMIEEGYDPLEVCDDSDGDLEYTISALSDEDGPLNMETGDLEQNVFYIHELQMELGYDDALLKGRVLDELPGLILSFLHIAPDILAFYPAPLEYTPDPAKEERYQILQSIAAQKIDSAIGPIIGEQPTEQPGGNVLKFADAYRFSEDELKFVTRRRYSGSSYPDEAKDLKEYAFYQENGFKEAGNSRLLYKFAGRI